MNDNKDMISRIIEKSDLKEKIGDAFSELEEEAKARLMEELENTLREKLREEIEKKREAIKKKAKKRLRKALIASALILCAGFIALKTDEITPYLKKLR